jgi:hypothetical protein
LNLVQARLPGSSTDNEARASDYFGVPAAFAFRLSISSRFVSGSEP